MAKARVGGGARRRLSYDELDAVLGSEQTAADCLRLVGMDGYLAGVAVGPGDPAPEAWVPELFGEEPPQFADKALALAVIDAINDRYLAIHDTLASGTYQPILRTSPDGPILAEEWAHGFTLAITLDPDAWEPMMTADEGVQLMAPILLLTSSEEERRELLDPEDEAGLMEDMLEVLPACVEDIDAFWAEREADDLPAIEAPLPPKVGRNEPCPCGSGKKFKKCCGGVRDGVR